MQTQPFWALLSSCMSLFLDVCILLPFPSGLTPSILLNTYILESEQRQPDFGAS